MFKYCEGDHVKVKSVGEIASLTDVDFKSDSGLIFTPQMVSNCGKTYPIRYCYLSDSGLPVYLLDDVLMLVAEEWIEPAMEEEKKPLKVKVRKIEARRKNPQQDSVNHPEHYAGGGIECIDAMIAALGKDSVLDFCVCNAMKYVWRHRNKNGKEDLQKAGWYLNKAVELIGDKVA